MRNTLSSGGDNPSPISVQTANGRAEFERVDPKSAKLVLDYEVDALEVQVPDASDEALRRAIEETCQQEIERMRASLHGLGDALAEQLSDEGRDPAIDHTTNYKESRTWTDGRTQFLVDPSAYHSETQLDGYEDASDARLVRQTVAVTVQQRELHIRELYRNMLADVSAARAARRQAAPAETAPSSFHSPPMSPA